MAGEHRTGVHTYRATIAWERSTGGGHAEGMMPEGEHPMRLTRILLRPRVLVAAGSDVSRFDALVHDAHEACDIASSLTTEVVVEATVEVAPKENPS